MNIYIYSDESGVFDRNHDDYYVYGGLLFTSKEERDAAVRMYLAVEKEVAQHYDKGIELKATTVKGKHKRRLFGATHNCCRFGGIVDQKTVNAGFYTHKKSRQRYLDFVYKLSVKNALLQLQQSGKLNLDSIERLIIYTDEHTTATDGIYELREAVYHELHIGTQNYEHNLFFPPILQNLQVVELKSCDSKQLPLVRAADIIANTIYRSCTKGIMLPKDVIIKKFP